MRAVAAWTTSPRNRRHSFSAPAPWQATLAEKTGRYWREDLPFTFDLPEGLDKAPAHVRALALVADWAPHDRTKAPCWVSL